MSAMRIRIDPADPSTLPKGRINPAVVDGTTEAEIALQQQEDEEQAMRFDHAALQVQAERITRDLSDRLGLRVHRALSWLKRSELCEDDEDARFIFLWIALNAAYADEFQRDADEGEQVMLQRFLRSLVSLDQRNLLYTLVWSRFSGPIRVLLNNEFVFQPFWDSQNGRIGQEEWKRKFERANRAAFRALGNRNQTATVLAIVLARLYTLRNQLVHGGATWQGSVNREQIRDGAAILGELTPLVIHLLIQNPDEDWGDPCYPVVNAPS